MGYDFGGKVAVVTGASRGIGKGIALEMALNGANIVGVYVSHEEQAKATAEEILKFGVEVEFIKADVSNERAVLTVRNRILERFGNVDFLINNAGIHQHLNFWEISISDWDRVLSTNLTSQFLVTKALVPGMQERGSGRIVNMSSCAAYSGTDHELHYGASKSGTIALTKSLALELAPYNINVNAVAPGYIETDMCVFDTKEQKERTESKIPMGRVGVPDDIAKMVSFLCSDGADYITGQMFHVNGGLIMP